MAIYWSNYTDFHRPSGLHYKMGRDGRGDPHLLCSGDEGSLKRDSVILHDHYWRRSGKWYVQVKKGKEHLLEDNTAFESIQQGVDKYLDEILKKLGG
ncbi:hypothetical protein [Anabaena sp. PCC 7108]|uniref:hypothetical protein n=1 Tax=Anabaena sp. PCC 7108 TaxID=163908 RepID=UPI00037716DB|nr:hypothetical protein [Anabaena sp. PCC 7108]